MSREKRSEESTFKQQSIFVRLSVEKMGNHSSQLDDHVYQIIGKYSALTSDDIQLWHERFSQRCSPGSTKMKKEEFCQFYQEIRPNENVRKLSENIFRAFDLNSDQGISFSEVKPIDIQRKDFERDFFLYFFPLLKFLIAHVSTTEAPLEDKLRYAFDVYDLDRNNSIDRAEIRFILRAMFDFLGMENSSCEECADTIMKHLDLDDDQRLSKEEFIEGLKRDSFLQSLMNPFQQI